jgi:TonB family protein
MPQEVARIEVWERWIGQSINGKFSLRQLLGGSDQSATFLIERDGQRAAVKLIAADVVNSDGQLTLWNRAAKLYHPHLIRLFEVGRCRLDSRDFIFAVMEYAEENLAQVLPNRALTTFETLDMLGPILEALGYLHHRGFVHGHLKPANILAVKEQVKLSSDGLLRSGEPKFGGGRTRAYDPPERAAGQVSPAGDSWSLGITLVEALTQQRPSLKANGEPFLSRKLPEPFHEIVSECLRRDPQQRATLAAITAKLKQASPAREQVPSESREAHLRRGLILSVVAAFAIIAVLVAVPRHPPRTTEPAKTTAAVREQSKAQANPVPSLTRSSPEQSAAPAPPPKPSPAHPQTGAAKVAETSNIPRQSDIAERVLPKVPESARNTIAGTVRVSVRVHVDPSGNVVGAEFDSAGPSNYFARLAMDAAQKWKFSPAPTPQEWILRFGFQRTGTNVSVSPVR